MTMTAARGTPGARQLGVEPPAVRDAGQAVDERLREQQVARPLERQVVAHAQPDEQRADRRRDEVDRPGLQRVRLIVGAGAAGDEDHRDARGRRIARETRADLDAVHAREGEVEQDQVRLQRLGDPQRVRPGGRLRHDVLVAQDRGEDLARGGVGVRDQQRPAGLRFVRGLVARVGVGGLAVRPADARRDRERDRRRPPRRGHLAGLLLRRRERLRRQREAERRSFRRRRLEPDFAAQEPLAEQLHRVGAEAASLRALGAEGALEDPLRDLAGNLPFVPHGERRPPAFDVVRRARRPARRRGLERVADHVEQHARRERRVGLDPRVRRRLDDERPSLRLRAERRDPLDVPQQGRRIDRPALERQRPGLGEHDRVVAHHLRRQPRRQPEHALRRRLAGRRIVVGQAARDPLEAAERADEMAQEDALQHVAPLRRADVLQHEGEQPLAGDLDRRAADAELGRAADAAAVDRHPALAARGGVVELRGEDRQHRAAVRAGLAGAAAAGPFRRVDAAEDLAGAQPLEPPLVVRLERQQHFGVRGDDLPPLVEEQHVAGEGVEQRPRHRILEAEAGRPPHVLLAGPFRRREERRRRSRPPAHRLLVVADHHRSAPRRDSMTISSPRSTADFPPWPPSPAPRSSPNPLEPPPAPTPSPRPPTNATCAGNDEALRGEMRSAVRGPADPSVKAVRRPPDGRPDAPPDARALPLEAASAGRPYGSSA